MAESISSKYNMRSPAVKRICQEIKELQRDNESADFMAEALESDIFEWHFVVRGPPGTEFEGGVYHGRVLLPPEYPFKPPSFMMLTPSGRFETGVKICLSISSHHPEHWQPSWSVRTALTALIAFMPSPGQGALGSLDFSKDERKLLAARSRTEVPKFGSPARQQVTEDMHKAMLQRLQQQQQQQPGQADEQGQQQGAQQKLGVQHAAAAMQKPEGTAAAAAPVQLAASGSAHAANAAMPGPSNGTHNAPAAAASSSSAADIAEPAAAAAPMDVAELQQWLHQRRPQAAAAAAAAAAATVSTSVPTAQARAQQQAWPSQAARQQQQQQQQQQRPQGADSLSDRALTVLAFVLSLAVAALLLKKVAGAWGGLGEIAASVSNF